MSPVESYASTIFIYMAWKCILQSPPWNDQWVPNDWYLHVAYIIMVASLAYATTNLFVSAREAQCKAFRFVTIIGRLIVAGVLTILFWNYIGLFFLSGLCAGGTYGQFKGCEHTWSSVQAVFIIYSLLVAVLCCMIVRFFNSGERRYILEIEEEGPQNDQRKLQQFIVMDVNAPPRFHIGL